jgi:uncharacterized protein
VWGGQARYATNRRTKMQLEDKNGASMDPRIKVITLGVSDLEKSLAFYRDGLGLPTRGIIGTEFEDGAVVFFDMNDDLILALYPKPALAKDARVSVGPPSPAEFSIGHIVRSKQEVDALMEQAQRAGAKITDPAHDRFWGGYSGYFQDPDGHLWEIAWNPAWEVRE